MPPAKCRRTPSQVDGYVKDLAGHNSHQFSLRMAHLVMQPAKHTSRRIRLIVLQELVVQPCLGESAGIPGFQEIAAIICENRRLQNFYVGNFRFDNFHDFRFQSHRAGLRAGVLQQVEKVFAISALEQRLGGAA